MESNYIIAFDKMPCCIYREGEETITQFTFPNSLVPASSLLKSGEDIIVNDKSFIIKDRLDIMGYTVVKCIENINNIM